MGEGGDGRMRRGGKDGEGCSSCRRRRRERRRVGRCIALPCVLIEIYPPNCSLYEAMERTQTERERETHTQKNEKEAEEGKRGKGRGGELETHREVICSCDDTLCVKSACTLKGSW